MNGSDPPAFPQNYGRGRRRCGEHIELPHGVARPNQEAGCVVEPRLLQGRRRVDAEDRRGVPQGEERRPRHLLHHPGRSPQQDHQRPHRPPRPRRGLLLLQRLGDHAQVRVGRPARGDHRHHQRPQAALHREVPRGRLLLRQQGQEARVLRRAHRGPDHAYSLLEGSRQGGRPARRPREDPHEVGRVLGVLEEGAG